MNDRLVLDHLAWARKVGRWYARRHPAIDRDDAASEAGLGLLRAARRFDIGRGVPFRVFARRWVVGHLRDWHRQYVDHLSRVHRGHVNRREAPDVRQERLVVRHHQPAVAWDGFAALERRDLLSVARRCLTTRERLVVLLHFDEGWTQKETARALGMRAEQVCVLLPGILKRMRERLLFDERSERV